MKGETVVILTGTAIVDPYSGEQTGTSWTNPVQVSVENVLCEPRPTGEPVQDARNSVVSGWTLYLLNGLPTGATLTPENRIRVRGLDDEVLGECADWRLSSISRGMVVQTKRVSG